MTEPNVYDPENPQEYVYDPELTNKWYWEDESGNRNRNKTNIPQTVDKPETPATLQPPTHGRTPLARCGTLNTRKLG